MLLAKRSQSPVKDKPSPRSSTEPTVVGAITSIEHHEDCGLKSCDCEDNVSPSASVKQDDIHVHEHAAAHVDDHADIHHHHDGCATYDPVKCHEHDLDLMKALMKPGDRLRDFVVVYALELSIAIHSIIIGVDIGLLSQKGDLVTLVTLIIAISFHQYIEGFSLGVAIIDASKHIASAGGVALLSSNMKILMFVLIFAVTVPIGILIGILTASAEETDAGVYAKGIANALAAGSLIYIAVAEMISHDFNSPGMRDSHGTKLGMLACLTTGVLLTAVLALWA